MEGDLPLVIMKQLVYGVRSYSGYSVPLDVGDSVGLDYNTNNILHMTSHYINLNIPSSFI